MLSDILTLGNKIDIKSLDRNGKPVHNARTYVSQLVDIVDYDVIHIAAPIVYSRPIILTVGENYNLCFYTEKGLYQCNCVVLSSHRENNTIVTVVRITTNLEKFQRRQYYRLECIHEIEYRVITLEEELLDRKLRMDEFRNAEERSECRKKFSEFDTQWVQAAIIDLSGGGARINSNIPHNPGDKIRIKLDLVSGNTLKKMLLNATVIASTRIINKTGFYEHRVEFKDIMMKDREELIKYIFEQERRRRSKS